MIAAAGLLAGAVAASAEDDYPNQPITLVVPNAAGGNLSATARELADPLSKELGQPIVIVNKVGAGGAIGATYAAEAKPDGYTLFFGGGGPLTVAPNQQPDIKYDPRTSFAPVAFIADIPYFLVARPSMPDTVQELVGKAKAEPGKINYAATGQGSTTQIAAFQFMKATGTDFYGVIYNGLAPTLPDLIANRVQILFAPDEALAPVKNGQLKALATMSRTRSPLVPEVPTLIESGIDLEFSNWYCVVAPAGTPEAIVTRLNEAINKVLNSEAYKELAARSGLEPNPGTPADLAKRIEVEFEGMKTVLSSIK